MLSKFSNNFNNNSLGYVVTGSDNEPYPYWLNKYLHTLAIRSTNTARQYAYVLCRYFNFLQTRNTNYIQAQDKDLRAFLVSLLYSNDHILNLKAENITDSTLHNYLTTIKGFYEFLFKNDREFNISLVQKKSSNQYSFYYGMIWEETKAELLKEPVFTSSKESKHYEKWYQQGQIEDLLNAFNKRRDKAIFSLSLDGLRIDEILSLQLNDFNAKDRTFQLHRSKGKKDYDYKRIALLSSRSVELIEDYLFFERSNVEEDLLEQNRYPDQTLFINLRKGEEYGQPIGYRNWLYILKRAAGKAGLDPETVITHSGRSTRAQELFYLQAKHPGKLSDSQICQIMGWKNISSSEPYKNRLDRKTALENLKLLESLEEEE